MKVIVCKEPNGFSYDFEGKHYLFEPNKAYKVEDNFATYLEEIVPLAFNFNPRLKEIDSSEEPQTQQIVNKYTNTTFGLNTTKTGNKEVVEDIKPGEDKDGVEWYGEGLTDDTP
jgi:hypothetical protein